MSPDQFRQTLGRFASGVTVVTARDPDGRPVGVTVSAFSSLSLEPPLILICLDRAGSHASLFRAGFRFAVNVLAEGQANLAERFAGPDPDKFVSVAVREGAEGLPLLDDALATLECRTVAEQEGGDHVIVVGGLERSSWRDGRPLLHFQGAYRRLGGPA